MRYVLALSIFASGLVAQSEQIVPDKFTNIWGRLNGTGTGLGTTGNSRAQYLYPGALSANDVVVDLGFRAQRGTVTIPAFTAEVEIRMSSTNVVPGAMSTTFSANVGSDESTVVPRAFFNISQTPPNRATSRFDLFPLQNPFVFGTNGAPNLLVDVLVYSTTNTAGATQYRVDRCFPGVNGNAGAFGAGCGTGAIDTVTTGGSFNPSSTFDVTLTGATPGANAWLLPSFNMNDLGGGFLVPLDLSFIGGGLGCELILNPNLQSIQTIVDGAGNAQVGLTIGGTAPELSVGFQWIYQVPVTPANPLGLETTGGEQVNVGPRTCDGQYCYELFDVNALTGTLLDGGAIVKMIVL